MIIDDDRDIVAIASAFLARRGFEVVSGHSGEDALAHIREARPHVILLDVMMPKMDGFWLCRVLKADAELADVPVLFLSARDDAAARNEARQSGGVEYVTKPFDLDDLESILRGVLSRTNKTSLIDQLDRRLGLGPHREMLVKLSAADLALLLDRVDAALSV